MPNITIRPFDDYVYYRRGWDEGFIGQKADEVLAGNDNYSRGYRSGARWRFWSLVLEATAMFVIGAMACTLFAQNVPLPA